MPPFVQIILNPEIQHVLNTSHLPGQNTAAGVLGSKAHAEHGGRGRQEETVQTVFCGLKSNLI